jgi:hypothetical protein
VWCRNRHIFTSNIVIFIRPNFNSALQLEQLAAKRVLNISLVIDSFVLVFGL